MLRKLTLALAAVTLVVGCKSARVGERRTSERPRDQYLILAKEIESTNRDNLLDAVYQLRPGWFNRVNRQQTGADGIFVYVDDRQIGDVSVLSRFSARSVSSVRYLGPTEAQVRYGQINLGRPAILLATVRVP